MTELSLLAPIQRPWVAWRQSLYAHSEGVAQGVPKISAG